MSGTSAGWSKERRAKHSAMMVLKNRDPEFIARRDTGKKWTPERRAAKSAQMKKLNEDPEFRAKRKLGILGRPRRGFTRIPDHIHPCVRGFYVEMNAQQAIRADIARRANVSVDVQSGWRRSMPLVDTLDAVLGALGYELAIVPAGTRDENGFFKKRRQQ